MVLSDADILRQQHEFFKKLNNKKGYLNQTIITIEQMKKDKVLSESPDIKNDLFIVPFHDGKRQYKGLSYGLSQCGYDLRLGSLQKKDFKITDNTQYKSNTQAIWLPPGGFILGSTFELVNVPRDLMGEIKDKSTWAREGIALQNTVIEPGWFGHITLEISNHNDKAILIEVGMPICQIIFHTLTSVCLTPYEGKYQGQINKPIQAIKEGDTNG